MVAVLLVSVSCASRGTDQGDSPSGSAAPSSTKLFATSPQRFDRLVRSSDGLPTVVNLWASWCVPCRAEMPRITKAAEKYAGDVRFLGLNTQDDDRSALEFIDQFDIPFPSGTDPRGEVARHLQALGLPATFFYRPDGELAFLHNGEISTKDLTEKIEELIRTSRRAK